ncbi:alpha/beta hydrolase [Hominifimenecus sp. rT4P-3]|uniref:alpha/beta hydrolase n=1 Tax=Hominifimenecus sp. rT4P-3 TaxID=3242979 RepID=UPI003DA3DF8E
MLYGKMNPRFIYTPEVMKEIAVYHKPDGLEVTETTIPGVEEGTVIEIKIYRPESETPLPMIMNIHGGGFVAGTYNNDNNRATYLAVHVPAVVVSLNYRLAPKYTYKEAIADCYQTWNWMYDHAEELGGIKEKMGLHGTSAGGNLCAGLAFYIRDHGGPKISLNALNCACLGIHTTHSAEQMRFEDVLVKGDGMADNVRLYCGGLNGQLPSYYAVPNVAQDFSGLPPTLVIAAEFDSLRDDSWEYVRHLQLDAIPVEFYIIPRSAHGFTAVSCKLTTWVEDGMVMSFQREFGMEE